ncbi:hypothetical protein HMPREF1624_06509 [Sporothrix schenckii ATCC 58251]|uniref:HTH CENPB-type domain-containing protein n=2 Tax=Sporothrix schenckii TaxID=29908 RepID=U7PNG1_SPOS1|nr:hypothetical protein HMPREF1624_06509 [Sporothrix schenckii ATCC 58251]
MASTGVDSEAQLSSETNQYDTSSWDNMNGYPQATMAGFANSDFVYMPPIASLDLPHDPLHRMPPPLQPRDSPQMKHEQDQLHQPQQQKLQQQHPPLSMGQATSHHHHQLPQLPMLTVPSNPTWPSMLTNPGSYNSPPMNNVVPRNGPSRPPPPPLKTKLNESSGRTGPRKMLTDDDRRRMCEYAEANPGVKQSEIGNIFGVERSTVSKVLRNKEKYLVKDKSPGSKKPKSKFPDIERALSNWVRNAQKTGVPVTDADIKEKFRFFATNTGSSDAVLKSTSNTWLEKFKQKNGIGAGRLVRRASETNIPDKRRGSKSTGMIGSPSLVSMEPTSVDSPLSPETRQPSASPLSASRSDEERNADSAGPPAVGQFINFGAGQSNGIGSSGQTSQIAHSGSLGNNMGMGLGMSGMAAYKHGNNQSTTSLSSVFTETPVSSFSGSALSPTVPFTFSPDSNVGSFLTSDPMAPPGSANFQRPRSQTLPALNLEYMNHVQGQHQQHNNDAMVSETTGESMTPKFQHQHHLPSTAPSSAVDSPMTDISAPSYGIDSTVVSPQLRRSNSSNSLFQSGSRSAGGLGGTTVLGVPMNTGGSSGGGVGGMPGSGGGGSSPSSPTQDDARRAADTLLNFIQHVPSAFDQTDYVAVSRLIEKLRLQATNKGHGSGGMGGLSRIPEGEGEMANDVHHTKLESALAA